MDKKCYVFCIGGTGLRVMKSAIMLMSAGMKSNGFTIVPIVIDPHIDLGERLMLSDLINQYKELRDSAYGKETIEEGFFCTPLQRSEDVMGETTTQLSTNEERKSFRQFINFGNVPSTDINHYLVQTLFSQQSLDNSLEVGFNPHCSVGRFYQQLLGRVRFVNC